LKKNPQMPESLRAYVASMTVVPSIANLHAGVSVLVTAVPGGECDTSTSQADDESGKSLRNFESLKSPAQMPKR